MGAVEKRLATKGFVLQASGTPDLLLHYHANITRRIDVDRVDRGRGYCYDDDCQAKVVEFEAGTIVLDILDAQTNHLIWRGWAQSDVEGMLRNQDTMARQINDAVERMLDRLPLAGVVTASPLSLNRGGLQ